MKTRSAVTLAFTFGLLVAGVTQSASAAQLSYEPISTSFRNLARA